MTLDELRRHLDELDRRLLQTIAERQATSREIARVKRATGYPTRDYARERDVIVGARSNAQQIGVSPDVAETVMRLLIRSSLDHPGAGQRRGARQRQRPARAGDRRRRQDGRLV
jgi:chorismate mutase/prephenate dehydrogenase